MAVDFSNYNDEDLDSLRVQILKEQERRASKSQIPEQIETLSREALAAGVSENELRDAVNKGFLDPEEPTVTE